MDQNVQQLQEPDRVPRPITLVSPGYVAEAFGVTTAALKAMWERGAIPTPIEIGGLRRFYLHEVQAVLDAANAARNAK